MALIGKDFTDDRKEKREEELFGLMQRQLDLTSFPVSESLTIRLGSTRRANY